MISDILFSVAMTLMISIMVWLGVSAVLDMRETAYERCAAATAFGENAKYLGGFESAIKTPELFEQAVLAAIDKRKECARVNRFKKVGLL